jgi:hypothetical protein
LIGLFAALAAPASLLTLTYADLQPPGLWRYANIHYFAWLLPMMGLGIVWLWEARRGVAERRAAVGALAALALALGVRVDPVAVGDAVPARMLRYRGSAARDWAEAYFAPVVIRDRRGAMANVNDFHQLPDATGERAIAVRRLFDRTPRRYDPHDLPGAFGRLPAARDGEAITWFGLRLS